MPAKKNSGGTMGIKATPLHLAGPINKHATEWMCEHVSESNQLAAHGLLMEGERISRGREEGEGHLQTRQMSNGRGNKM